MGDGGGGSTGVVAVLGDFSDLRLSQRSSRGAADCSAARPPG
jgi:hypothetical protein